MRYISLFSGIEAATVAWEQLGWEHVAFCEIDEFPSAVLAHHYPDVTNLGDITKVDWKEVIDEHGAVDLIVGGSPCQSFSVAGGRESLDGESALCFEYWRAIRDARPTWFLWENVPGVLNTRDNAFGQFLWKLEGLGYGMAWRVLDAQFFGVAQRRRRVFLVGHLGDGGGAAAVLFESESVSGNTQTSRGKREELARAAGRDASARGGEGDCLNPWDVQSKRIFPEDGTAPTLQSESGEGMNIHPSVLRAQTIDYKQTPKTSDEISHTLTHEGRGGIHSAVASKYSAGAAARTMPTYEDGSTPTLTADYHAPAIAFAQNTRDEVRIVGGDGQTVGALAASPGMKQQSYVAQRMAVTIHDGSKWVVRRLTPVECERLQGFPDGWTDIPYRGKEHPPDTPRYKAIGNSMAVPVMRWLGERIQMVQDIMDEMEQ